MELLQTTQPQPSAHGCRYKRNIQDKTQSFPRPRKPTACHLALHLETHAKRLIIRNSQQDKIRRSLLQTKMKLTITTDTFLPRLDGVSRFISNLIPFLSHEITILAPSFGETLKFKNAVV